MISFPLFTELEAKRDTINAKFHRETEPQLIERFQQFGFVPRDGKTRTTCLSRRRARATSTC